MMVSFQHLRVCQLYKSYIDAICKLQSSRYKILKKDYKSEIDKLYYVRGMIEDAVNMVEECLDKERGLELYEEAKSMLDGCNRCQ